VSSSRFLATIYKIWMLRYVDVPEEIGRALEKESGKKKHIPVVAIVNGRSTRTTIMPAGGGHYRLQFNVTLRKAARADVGNVVGVELRLDRKSRAMLYPPDLRAPLERHPRLQKEFARLAPGLRRQFLLALLRAKSPQTRQKRIARLLEILLERTLLGNRAKKKKKPSLSS
jgi:Bacteriocin-protection, YdeI or OmpD-Associated/Domain of unknown function (DUF1905)